MDKSIKLNLDFNGNVIRVQGTKNEPLFNTKDILKILKCTFKDLNKVTHPFINEIEVLNIWSISKINDIEIVDFYNFFIDFLHSLS